MDLALRDRIALVSGSSAGIGLAIATALLEEGARVVVNGRNAERLARSSSELKQRFGEDRVIAVAADCGVPEGIARVIETVERLGHLDILVANVGSGRSKGGWDLTDADFQGAFETNFFGGTRLVTACIPHLTPKAASIVLLASIVGREITRAPIAYAAAKSALITYGAYLSRAVADRGIRVNSVAPGNVAFEGGRWAELRSADPDGVRTYIESEVAMKRFGTPEEIAKVVTFLASPAASFVTGACVVADGGQVRGF